MNTILAHFTAFLLGILVLDVLWQVFSRFVLRSPSGFTDELAGFLLIWVGLLGAAYMTGQEGHLSVDLFSSKLSEKLLLRIKTVQYLMILLFSFSVMIIGGGWLVYTRFILGVTSPAMHIPLGYVYIVIPLSGVLIAYYALHFITHPAKMS